MPRLRNRSSGVVVNVSDDTAARLGPEWAPEPRGTKPEPRTEPQVEGHACPDCEFTAKTPAGLGAHRRRHD